MRFIKNSSLDHSFIIATSKSIQYDNYYRNNYLRLFIKYLTNVHSYYYLLINFNNSFYICGRRTKISYMRN